MSLWFLSHSLLTNNTYDTLRAVPATVFTLDVLLASPLRAPVCTKPRSKAPGRSDQCACQLRWETRSRHTRKPQLNCPLPTRHTIATIMRFHHPGFFGLPEAPCTVYPRSSLALGAGSISYCAAFFQGTLHSYAHAHVQFLTNLENSERARCMCTAFCIIYTARLDFV